MAIQYAPLFALETQFQTKDGRNNTGGWLKVFLAATDDPATTYSDYNGTRNPEKIVLDDDGRALVICDKSKAYRLEVYSMDGTLLWTEEPVYCSGTGGGGVSITKVVSTDGSISVDENVAGSTTTYDLGIAHSSDEFLEWIKCSENECGATWYPVFQDGSMETEAGKGIKVHKGHLYHFTNSFTVDPDGTGVNYDTFRVSMYCGDAIVDEHDFDIDSSLNDQVLCEFSRDVVPSKDTHVYFKLTIPATCKASGEVQCHRIYSGINAVPDTCATKQWVSGSYQPLSGMSSYVPYSSVGNNGIGQVTSINGSAIVGGLDSASVSSIASSVASAYTDSALSSLSSKADSSALSSYQPVSAMGAYATTAYVDGRVSGKLDTTAFNSGDFYSTANPSGFITGVDLGNYATTGFVESAVSGKLDTTAFNPGDFYTTANESGFVGRAYVDSSVSGKLDTTAFASASAGFAPTGDYAYNSSLTSYIPASASGELQPSGDYALNSAVSSKLDASASGDFVANSAMTSWIPYSALDYSGTAISGIGGSSLAGMGGGGVTGDYVEKSSIEVVIGSGTTAFDTAFAQGVNCSASARSFAQGFLNTAGFNSFAQGYYNSAISYGFAHGESNIAFDCSFAQGLGNRAKFCSFAQGLGNRAVYSAAVFGSYNLHGNGDTATGDSAAFAIGDGTYKARHDLMLVTKNGEITMYSSTADTVGLGLVSSIKAISAAASGGVDSATVSAIASSYSQSAASSKLDTTAFNSGDFYSTSNPSGFVGSAYVDSVVSGKLDTSEFASASAGFQPTGDYAFNSSLGLYIPVSASGAFQPSGDYAFNSAVSSKLDASASDFFVMYSSMTSWIPYSALDYSGTAISGIGGSSLAGMGGGDYTGIYPVNVDNDTREIAVDSMPLVTDSSMTAYGSAGSSVIGVNLDILSGKQDTLAFSYNSANQISSINGSALGGMDEAAVSGIASAYAQSAASSKLDSSAFNSADFYSTSNPSGFITGVDLTPYQPTSAMSAYATTAFVESGLSGKENVFSAGIGLEFVQSGSDRVLQVEAPVDIVAGPGIVIDNPDGNTLRVSQAYPTDETVLYESSNGALDTIPLSESLSNFERVKIIWKDWSSFDCINIQEFDTKSSNFMLTCTWAGASTSIIIFSIAMLPNAEKTALTNLFARFISFSNTSSISTASNTRILKVIGCHRIANN